jgi:hypothetical protein
VILDAVSPNGVLQSTVRVDDAVWASSWATIKQYGLDKGYTFLTRDTAEAGEVERNCESLVEVKVWIDTLNTDED